MMKRLIELLSPSEGEYNQSGLTNKRLIERIADEFEAELDKASTDDKILFPMSFTILLHPNDYSKISQYFAPVTQSIVQNFYKIIEKHKEKSFTEKCVGVFFKKPNIYREVTPIGYNWEFILTKTTVSNVGGIEVGIDNPAFIISATARVYGSNVSASSSVKVSVSCLNSDPSKSTEMNIDTLKGINLIGDNHYLISFNKNLLYTDNDAKSSEGNYGYLEYKEKGKVYTFTIKDEIVSISGAKDKRTQRNIFKIPTSELKNDHVQIKFEKSSEKYYISTIADDTRLNQRKITQSIGTPVWVEMPNNSEIFMSGIFSVRFKKNI